MMLIFHWIFSPSLTSSLPTSEDNWIGYFNDSYMPTLLSKTKWIKNANVAFYFNAKMGNNTSNYLTNGNCLNGRVLN